MRTDSGAERSRAIPANEVRTPSNAPGGIDEGASRSAVVRAYGLHEIRVNPWSGPATSIVGANKPVSNHIERRRMAGVASLAAATN